MWGTIVNSLLIIMGAFLGLLLKKGIPERYQMTVMQGLGIVVGVIGLQMAMKSNNLLIVIVSIALGGLLGEAIDFDKRLKGIGDRLAAWVSALSGNKEEASGNRLSEGFVTASLVYCVGAMSVVGSIQEGLTGDASTLYAKSLIDGITAIFFTSSLGIGVAFSAVSVFLYQGTITLLAGFFAAFLSEQIIAEMTATGGALILGISLLMLRLSTIRVANLLPAIVFAVIITFFYNKFV